MFMNEYVSPEIDIDEPEPIVSFVLGPVVFVFAGVVWQVGIAMDYAAIANVAAGVDVLAVAYVSVDVDLDVD